MLQFVHTESSTGDSGILYLQRFIWHTNGRNFESQFFIASESFCSSPVLFSPSLIGHWSDQGCVSTNGDERTNRWISSHSFTSDVLRRKTNDHHRFAGNLKETGQEEVFRLGSLQGDISFKMKSHVGTRTVSLTKALIYGVLEKVLKETHTPSS